MMNLDEAIKHCEEVAEENEEIYEAHCRIYSKEVVEKYPSPPCKKCAEEHRQLAEWLKELKAYREEAQGMKLLIDIPERIYEHAKESSEDSRDEFDAMRAIANGTQQESSSEIPNKSEIPTCCGDAISRQAAIEAIEALQLPIMREASSCYQFKFSGMSEAKEAVVNLPSVTLQQRTGRWERMSDLPNDVDDRFKCSRCGNIVHHRSVMDLRTFSRWCGRCGSYNG